MTCSGIRENQLPVDSSAVDILTGGTRHPGYLSTPDALTEGNGENQSCTDTTQDTNGTLIAQDGSAFDALFSAAQHFDNSASSGPVVSLYSGEYPQCIPSRVKARR